MNEKELLNDLSVFIDTYNDFFNESFPLFFMKNKNTEELINIIKKCIENNKTVYDLGLIEINDNEIY